MGFTSPPPPPDRVAEELWKTSLATRGETTYITWEKLDVSTKNAWRAVATKAIELIDPAVLGAPVPKT